MIYIVLCGFFMQCEPKKFHFGIEAIVFIPLQRYKPKTHSYYVKHTNDTKYHPKIPKIPYRGYVLFFENYFQSLIIKDSNKA